MSIHSVDGLITDIEAPFQLLAVALVFLFINSKMSRQTQFYLLTFRLAMCLIIFGFLVMLGMITWQDRSTLIALWEQHPFLYSLVYPLFWVLVLAGVAAIAYWKLRPELWRNEDEQSGDCCPK
jgi:hypothetical protein